MKNSWEWRNKSNFIHLMHWLFQLTAASLYPAVSQTRSKPMPKEPETYWDVTTHKSIKFQTNQFFKLHLKATRINQKRSSLTQEDSTKEMSS